MIHSSSFIESQIGEDFWEYCEDAPAESKELFKSMEALFVESSELKKNCVSPKLIISSFGGMYFFFKGKEI